MRAGPHQSLATRAGHDQSLATRITPRSNYSVYLTLARSKFSAHQSLAWSKFSAYQSLARTKVSRDQSLAKDPQNAKLWCALNISDLQYLSKQCNWKYTSKLVSHHKPLFLLLTVHPYNLPLISWTVVETQEIFGTRTNWHSRNKIQNNQVNS